MSSAGDDYSKTYNYTEKNKVETLAMYVKSATKKRPGNFRQYSRAEISKVVGNIVEESSIKNQLPRNDSQNDHEPLIIGDEKTRFTTEL